jgi:hypothetical protein
MTLDSYLNGVTYPPTLRVVKKILHIVLPALLRFATLAISTEHQPRFLRLGGPVVRRIELPTPISACLRTFIGVLLNEDSPDFCEMTNAKTSAPNPRTTTPKRATSACQESSRSRLRRA